MPILCISLALIAIGAAAFFWLRPRLQPEYVPLRYEEFIFRYSAEYDLDPFLVMAVIRVESSFRAGAVSPVGATGLMQLMPNTAADLAGRMGIDFEPDDLRDPAFNIRMGSFYLRRLINIFGHQDTALAAYNAGMGNVRRWLDEGYYSDDGETLHTIPFPETRAYVARVNRYIEIYREMHS